MNKIRQVHCLLDSIRWVLEKEGVNQCLPLYFGAWDCPFDINDEGSITYFSDKLSSGISKEALSGLYNLSLTTWYDYKADKQTNWRRFLQLSRKASAGDYLLPQLDLFELSYMKTCYKTIHRPHFVIATPETSDRWRIIDPFFEFEGTIPKGELEAAFCQNSLGDGYAAQPESLQAPSEPAAARFFESSWEREEPTLAEAFISLLERVQRNDGEGMRQLASSVEQLGIIADRKQSYLYAFAYFKGDKFASLEQEQEWITHLLKGWRSVAYASIRLAIKDDRQGLAPLIHKVKSLDVEEEVLRHQLWRSYEHWRAECV